MNKRLCVIAFEKTKDMSENDRDEFYELLELLSKKYHFKWSQTFNSNWVRCLIKEMEESENEE